MKIDNDFILLASENGNFNQMQLEILKYDKDELLDKEINDSDAALVVLLRGDFDIKEQTKIIENYKRVKELKQLIKKHKEVKNSFDKSKLVQIFCDGACIPNPGEAGSGVVVYADGDLPVLYYGDYVKYGTNNIAELNALYKALLIAKEALISGSDIIINSDSKYSIDCITKWAYGWKSKGWSKKGGEIKNLALIQKLHTLYDEIKDKITLNYVKGHSGIEGNELADRMGMLAIKYQNIEYKSYKYKSLDEVLKLEFDK